MTTTPWITIFAAVSLTAPVLAQEAESPSPNDRARALLTRLAEQPSMRFVSKTRNVAYEERMKLAAAQGRPVRKFQRFRFSGVKTGGVMAWTAAPIDGGDDAERHILMRRGARWWMKDAGEDWVATNRPTGIWHSTYLPDPAYLARALLELPKAEWKLQVETIDDKMLRVYRLKLTADVARRLVRRGAVPDSSDIMSGVGTVARGYLGRQIRTPERDLEIRMYDDPKAKLPKRFKIDVYQGNMRTAGGIAIRVGGLAPPAPRGKKAGPNEKQLYLSTELEVHDVGSAKLDLDDAGRALVEKK